jgi:hypothetical protein
MSASSMKLQTETFTAEKVKLQSCYGFQWCILWSFNSVLTLGDVFRLQQILNSYCITYICLCSIMMHIMLTYLSFSHVFHSTITETAIKHLKKVNCCVFSHRKRWQLSSSGRLLLQRAFSTMRNMWQRLLSPISPLRPKACAQSHPQYQQPHRYAAVCHAVE